MGPVLKLLLVNGREKTHDKKLEINVGVTEDRHIQSIQHL